MSYPDPFQSRRAQEDYAYALRHGLLRGERAMRPAPHNPHQWAFQYSEHPRAFMREIIGPEWDTPEWESWRAFISTVFCEPFATAGEWRIFRKCTQLIEPPPRRPPSVWMPVGRRGGKSRMLAAIAVWLGCCFDWSPFLSAGETGVLPVLAADRRQARTIMGYIKAFLDHPRLAPLQLTDQAESILLEGNILIEVVTASFRAVRNRTVIAALLDEVAFWRSDEDSSNPDHEIIAALEPAMATIPNALLLAASSPYSRRGVLWDHYDRYFGKPGGPLVWQAPTRVMHPSVSLDFINSKYAEDPLAAAAEYGALFRSDVDAFITREALDAVIARGLYEIPFAYNVSYKAFVDPSGGSSDSFTLAIGHVDPATRFAVLDCVRERVPPFSPEGVVSEFADLLLAYRINRIRGDHYAGEWPRERFSRCGIQYEISKRRKSDIYVEFLPILNAGRCSLLDNRTLYNQLANLERRTSRGGLESIDHGPGAHDDVANVVAGVMVDLVGKRDPTSVDPGVLLRSRMMYRPQYPPLGSTNQVPLDPTGRGAGGPVWR